MKKIMISLLTGLFITELGNNKYEGLFVTETGVKFLSDFSNVLFNIKR